MNVMVINAGRKTGNSNCVVSECLCEAKKHPVNISPVHLGSKRIRFCDGCLSCDETGKCHIKDDMQSLIDTAVKSDAFFFVSPTRWSLLSGELKTFMDRLNPLAASEKLSGKSSAIICIGQSEFSNDNSINYAIKSIVHFCDNAGIKVVGSVGIEKCLNEGDVNTLTTDIQKCISLFKELLGNNE